MLQPRRRASFTIAKGSASLPWRRYAATRMPGRSRRARLTTDAKEEVACARVSSDRARLRARMSRRSRSRSAACFMPDTAALGDRALQGKGGATRLCRHVPLLSTRSNRWDAATTVKASRSRRTCTVLPRDRTPGVLTLGSRGNPTQCRTPQAAPPLRLQGPGYRSSRGSMAGAMPDRTDDLVTARVVGPLSRPFPRARAVGGSSARLRCR